MVWLYIVCSRYMSDKSGKYYKSYKSYKSYNNEIKGGFD